MSGARRVACRPVGRRGARRTATGSATIYAAGGMALLAALALGAVFLVGALATKHRVSSAADLAALAAAGAVREGADACALGAQIASRNGATLTSCSVADRSVTVAVSATAPALLGLVLDVSSSARAGWSALPGG